MPRPLYGLERLAARPEVRVIITEGEKAADAAGALLPGWVAVTSPGGGQGCGEGGLGTSQASDWSYRDATG